METAYLYLRVSTDEQKRKGYSLPEQEDRLLKYCEFNNIEVKGIYREDFSAKNFNRPEWKKLIAIIRKDRGKIENSILFIKWDRFSRNIEYAYEMIGILRKSCTKAMAIDQPIDFTVPESTVMLAVYLSIPEAENSRRALNTVAGIRRAKMMGRHPNKAPIGFVNSTTLDGKKHIIPTQPEADIIKWAFKQLSKNSFKIEDVRKMACVKGLICSRSNFWKVIRNPVYCGLIELSFKDKESEFIKAVHEPLITESLFYEVQDILNSKRKITCKSVELDTTFFLKGFITCPSCGRKLRGSFSRGSTKRYPYYHCSKGCKMRINADVLNSHYNEKLQQLSLSTSAMELFSLILEDINVGAQKIKYIQERKYLIKELEEQQLVVSKARRLFIINKLKFEDFNEVKKECRIITDKFGVELIRNSANLRRLEQQLKFSNKSFANIFQGYLDINSSDKKQIISLIQPINIDIKTNEISLKVHRALSKILLFSTLPDKFEIINSNNQLKNFANRIILIKRAIAIMLKNKIQIDESEATVIVDFLYIMAKTYSFNDAKHVNNPKWMSNHLKTG